MERIKSIQNEEVPMKQSQWNYVIKDVFNDIIQELNIHIEDLHFCVTYDELKEKEGAIWALVRLLEIYDIDLTTTKALEKIEDTVEKVYEKINEKCKELLKWKI